MFDRIKNWNLKRKIPKIYKDGGRTRLAGDGITKIPVDENDEVKKYNYARKRQKEKDNLELWEKNWITN